MKRFFAMMASTAALLCLSGTRAQASPVDWNYSFTPNQPSVSATPNGSLQFTGAQSAAAVGSSTLVLANLQLQSNASGTNTLANGSLPFSGTISLQDTNGTTGSITLSGSLGGYNGTSPSFSAGSATNPAGFSNITSLSPLALSNAVAPAGTSWSTTGSGSSLAYVWTDSKTGNTFSIPVVDLGITPPGPPVPLSSATSTTVPQKALVGSISAYVVVNGSSAPPPPPPPSGGTGTGTGTTSGVPEPSTLVLSCFGLSFAGLASWRKRRRGVKA
jgi:hypothetical protein